MRTAEQSLKIPSSGLCTSCGFCCDGTLFARTELDEGEVQRLKKSGYAVTMTRGAPRLVQPCCFFADKYCTIYETRFAVCAKFRCDLLKKLDAGEVSPTEVSGIVAEAKRLREEALVADGGKDPAVSFRDRMLRKSDWHELQGDERMQRAGASLKLLACRHFLAKHFRKRLQMRDVGFAQPVRCGLRPAFLTQGERREPVSSQVSNRPPDA